MADVVWLVVVAMSRGGIPLAAMACDLFDTEGLTNAMRLSRVFLLIYFLYSCCRGARGLAVWLGFLNV